MGRYTFRLPDIGEGIAEAEIVAWHVKVGDRIEEDGRLADVMTDKATVEMESPVSGIVREIAGEAGDTIAIGSALAVIEIEGDEVEDAPAPSEVVERIDAETPDAGDVERAIEANAQPTPPKPVRAELVEAPSFPSATSPRKSSPATSSGPTGKGLASPAVRARASALGIDLGSVPTQPDGIVRHADLDALLLAARPAAPSLQSAKPEPPKPAIGTLPGAGEQIRLIGLRRRIAENMAASKRHIPHFSYIDECDVTALEGLRAELNALGGERPKLTLLPLLIAAICRTLPEFPMLNARFDDEAGLVTRYDAVHVGMATQTPAGLMVPVIHDAQSKSVWGLATEIRRLAAAARDGTAKSEELSGSTITVTSLGPLGGVATTPVINRPEVAIIGPNRIIERPVYVGNTLERRKLMNVSISCDHRVVDGWDAASYVQALKRLLESPMLLLAG